MTSKDQISEDYCSYKVAKLLKEKGFEGECGMIYREHDMQRIYHIPKPNDLLDFTTNREKLEKHSKKQHCDYALCPTLQMAMKWLREVHHCVICITPMTFYCGEIVSEWGYYIWAVDNKEVDEERSPRLESYEEACETAIKYCLENLI